MITPLEVLSPLPDCVERRIDTALRKFHRHGGEITVFFDDFFIEITAGLIEEIRRHYEAVGWKTTVTGVSMTFRL